MQYVSYCTEKSTFHYLIKTSRAIRHIQGMLYALIQRIIVLRRLTLCLEQNLCPLIRNYEHDSIASFVHVTIMPNETMNNVVSMENCFSTECAFFSQR